MKYMTIILLVCAVTSIITIPRTSGSDVQDRLTNQDELLEKEETRHTFRLAPGTRVEVSSIRGRVEIEMADVEVAEIHIVRAAQNRAALEQYKVDLEHNPQSLIIRGAQRQSNARSVSGSDVRHQVRLKLPRAINLSVRSVSGDVQIVGDIGGQLAARSISGTLSVGAVRGQVDVSSVSGSATIGDVSQQVEIESVSGNVSVGQAVGYLNISSVSGNVSAGISKIGQRGVQVKHIGGQVELRFRDELNAQLNAGHISGKVYLEVPNVTVQSKAGSSNLRALIGKGTHPISINSVSRYVRLAQGT